MSRNRRTSVTSVSSVGPKEDPSQLDEASKEKLQEQIYEQLNISPIKVKVLVVLLMFVFALIGLVYSLQAPFYPEEGRSKNLTGTENGIVFGVFSLAGFVLSIPAGKITSLLGAKLYTVLGSLLLGFSTIGFGFVTYIMSKPLFLGICILLRILQGLGVNAVSIGVMTILTTSFPRYSGTMVSWTETMYGVGLIIGPAIGGPLFDAGGFLLPFLIIGCITTLTTPGTCFVVPSDKRLNSVSMYREANTKLFGLLTNLRIWFGFIALMSGGIAIGYIEATLEPHLESFHLSGTYTGLIFLLFGVGYGGSTPVWGWVCDKGFSCLVSILLGEALMIIGYFLMGPAPFFQVDKSLSLILPGLALASVGMGGTMPPAFVYMKTNTLQLGFPDNIETNSMLSSFFIGGILLGTFIGPLIGGALYDAIGFAMGCMAFSAFHAIIGIISLIIFVVDRNKAKQPQTQEKDMVMIKEEMPQNNGLGLENLAVTTELENE